MLLSLYFISVTEFISEICFNLGKKSGGKTKEEATGGQPEKESAQKTAVSGGEHAGPHWPQQRKKHVEPSMSSGGGDITSGPSQWPEGKRSVTAGPSQRPEGERSVTAGPSQWPEGERQKQKQSQKQLAHVAGKEGEKKKGQAGSSNLILFILFVVLTVTYMCQHMHTIKLEGVHKPKPSYTFE